MTSIVQLKDINEINGNCDVIHLIADRSAVQELGFSEAEANYVKEVFQQKEKIVVVNHYTHQSIVVLVPDTTKLEKKEKLRLLGKDVCARINAMKKDEVEVDGSRVSEEQTVCFLEGLVLANYQFLTYFSDAKKIENSLVEVGVKGLSEKQVGELSTVLEGVYLCRDLVNEPVITLDAVELADRFTKLGREAGLSVEVFDKDQITDLGMGGLLGVNYGSEIPPTFSIMEWKPEGAKNENPIVMVGKGVVYDTGGLSLKPTANSMDLMKSDMGGAATVFSSIYTAARLNLPVWIVALVPATDNRPGKNAVTPGDVLEMYNGKTVEVKNTDAEGRLILADGLSYGDKYKPELMMSWATLTGAAAYSIGPTAAVMMGDADPEVKAKLMEAGEEVHERMVEFPFWSDYDEEIKSDIADISNLGGAWGGAITAGKFLKNFTDHAYIHVDIAGPCFLTAPRGYNPKGGSGYGVRALVNFFKKY